MEAPIIKFLKLYVTYTHSSIGPNRHYARCTVTHPILCAMHFQCNFVMCVAGAILHTRRVDVCVVDVHIDMKHGFLPHVCTESYPFCLAHILHWMNIAQRVKLVLKHPHILRYDTHNVMSK